MKISIWDGFQADWTNVFGQDWNVTPADMEACGAAIARAAGAAARIRESGCGPREGERVLFPHLPYLLQEKTLMPEEEITAMEALSAECRGGFDAVLSVGIGGSYLGNQALFDACCGPYWNLMTREARGGRPQVFFAGETADPEALSSLLRYLRTQAEAKNGTYRVLTLVISKSGTTVEPSGALSVLERELPRFCDEARFAAVTDKAKGALLAKCRERGWLHFTVPEGIGGRFSVFSQVGIVFASLLGLDIRAFLRGARLTEESCRSEDWRENPALALAAMKYIASRNYGVTAEIVMPYCARLRSLGGWYAQLLGESLGKKDTVDGRPAYGGRTPVCAVGTTDMHSLTQEHQEGRPNKLLQFIAVEEPAADLDFQLEEGGRPCTVPMSRVMKAALRANAEALASAHKMSCVLSIRKVNELYLGGLMYFFFLTIAYEGAMAGIDAYDQPGVEAYKKILHQDLAQYAGPV